MLSKNASMLTAAVLACSLTVVSFGAVGDILDADYEALEQPLLPHQAPSVVAKISAHLGYMWSLPDGVQAMVLLGEFRLDLPDQELTSDDAVIWMTTTHREGQPVKKLDVFMEGNAHVVEKAGGVTSDQVLFLTVWTTAKIEVTGEGLVVRDGSDQPIYGRALQAKSKEAPSVSVPPDQIVIHGPASKTAPRERRPITVNGNIFLGPDVEGRPVLIGTEGIYLIQSAGPDGEATELRATNVVLFLKRDVMGTVDSSARKDKAKPESPGATAEELRKRFEQLPTEDKAARQLSPIEQARMNEYVSAAYLEGDVVLSRGYRRVRADQMYYDFEQSKALIHNFVATTLAPQRNVPVYVRAALGRQLSEREYVAYNAKMSTSEFYTPSYHVGATTVYFEDRTERTEAGRQIGLAAGTFKAHNVTFNVEGVPLLYWPYLRGDFKQSETALRSVNVSYDSEFGATGKTRWYLFPVIGLDQPEGTDATLRADYFGDRGPAVGIDMDYERDDYFGLLRTYAIHDTGEDQLGGWRGDVEPPYENRGRALIRHRQYLPYDWELTVEASYLSDRNFLEEYFRSEFDEGKEQETLIYLKKLLGDDMIFSILGNWRINDFLTQTEHLPDARFDILGTSFADGLVTWYSENRVGAVRFRVDHDIPSWFIESTRYDNTHTVARGDSRQELEVPFTLGPLKIVGFGVIRGSAWDDAPYTRGGIGRLYGGYGVRGSLYQSRVYEGVASRLLDLYRLRHIMKEDFTVWASHDNHGSLELTPFDEGIESIDEVDGVSFGWRHRFQTKRGPADNRRTVDWLTLDFEAGFFNDAVQEYRNRTRGQTFSYKPENSITSNYLSMRSVWRISDSTALLYDAILDTDDCAMGSSAVGLHVDRDPRFSWFFGHRYIHLSDSNLLATGFNYRLNPKYTVSVREEYDLDRGKNADLGVTLVRKMPRWYFALTVEFDETENVDSVSISIWPEGIPEWAVGSRRYTGLETSTGLRP